MEKTTITISKELAKEIKIEAAKMYMTIAEYVAYMVATVKGK